MRRSRSWAAATALAVAAVAAAVVAAPGDAGAAPAVPAAPAATSGPCPQADQGVTVVVDFGAFGGGVVTRCAPGAPSSGFAALRDAGFVVTPVSSNHGFLCRIDGLPGPEADRCQEIPPSSAYWKYSLAERGGTWRASNRGAGNRTPPPGTVEGWAFGAGASPSVPPPPPPPPPPPTTAAPATAAPPPPPAAPAPPADEPASAAPPDTGPARPPTGSRPGGTDPAGPAPGDEDGSDPADGVEPEPVPDDGAEGSDAPVDDRRGGSGRPPEDDDRAAADLVVTDRDEPDRGAPLATAAGVGLVAALGGAAAWQARRRRAADPGAGGDLP